MLCAWPRRGLPALFVAALTACTALTEFTSPLSERSGLEIDTRLVGTWYGISSLCPLLSPAERTAQSSCPPALLTLLDISSDADNKELLVRATAIALHVPGTTDSAQEWRTSQGRMLNLEATAYPTRLDGATFYNVRRRAKVGYDYSAPGEQPHYILAELDVSPRDALELRLVWLVDGNVGGKAVRQRKVKSPGDFEYPIVEASTEHLIAMVREANLLRFAIGPFRRVTSELTAAGLETQLSTWPSSTRLLPRLYALARVANGLAQAGLPAPALQCARLAFEIEAGAASDPVPPSFGDNGNWIEALGLLAQAQWIAGEPSSARTTLDRVQKKPGFRPRLATPAYVGALALDGRTPEALALARGLQDVSHRSAAFAAIAVVQAQRGDLAAALETVRQERSAKIALDVADALADRGELAGTRSMLGLAAGLAAEDRAALLMAAQRQFERGDPDAARDTARAAAAAPSPARGLTAPAAAHLSDAMERLSIAELQAQVGDLEGARRTFELALGPLSAERSTYTPLPQDRVIALQVRLGDRSGAQRTLRQVVTLGNADSIARAYAANGDVEAAIARAADRSASLLYDIAEERRRAGDAAGVSRVLRLALAKWRNEIDAQMQAADGGRRKTVDRLFDDALERAQQHARAGDREASAYVFAFARERVRTFDLEHSDVVGLEIKVAKAQRRTGDLDGARMTWLEACELARRIPESDGFAVAYALPGLADLARETPAEDEKH